MKTAVHTSSLMRTARRVDGWEAILERELEAALSAEFEYGKHDCCVWALKVRAAILGIRFSMPKGFGRYRSAKAAVKALKRNKYDTLVDAGKAILGEPLPSPIMAQRGDIAVATPLEGAPDEWRAFGGAACIVGFNGSLFAPGIDRRDGGEVNSLAELPIEAAVAAWRV